MSLRRICTKYKSQVSWLWLDCIQFVKDHPHSNVKVIVTCQALLEKISGNKYKRYLDSQQKALLKYIKMYLKQNYHLQ